MSGLEKQRALPQRRPWAHTSQKPNTEVGRIRNGRIGVPNRDMQAFVAAPERTQGLLSPKRDLPTHAANWL